jgi:ribosomal-protein-alanine N-acetyltransferase
MTGRRDVEIRPFRPEEAMAAASWRYPGELAMYDGDQSAGHGFLVRSESGHGYYAIVDHGEFVGFCCFGPEGRVPGQPAEGEGLLDVGGGIRPDLVGRGLGGVGLPVVLAFARQRFSPLGFRTAIASFNRRSITLCRWIGFRPTATFLGPGEREFTELVLVDDHGAQRAPVESG